MKEIKISKFQLFFFVFITVLLFSIPIKSFAATCYILTNKQLYNRAQILSKDLLNVYKTRGDSRSKCTILSYSDKKSFISKWNSINSADLIVILDHGEYTTTAYMQSNNIHDLDSCNCKCLWLLGCNTAHSHHENQNIASAFSKVINGVVVASDGNVRGTYYSNNAYYTSHDSTTWQRQCLNGINTTQRGWAYIKATPDYTKPQIYIKRLDVYIADQKTPTH